MKAGAHTAVLLLTLALLTLPAHIRTQQQEPIVLRYRGIVYPGDVLAPHLYDWSFDGVDDYVRVPTFSRPQNFTILSWMYLTTTNHENPVVTMPTAEFYGCYWKRLRFNAYTVEADWKQILSPYLSWTLYSWYLVGTSYDAYNKSVTFFRNDVVYGPYSYPYTLRDVPSYIDVGKHGPYYFPGAFGVVLIYSRVLSGSEVQQVYSANIVSTAGLVLFLDPTFFDGTKYVDLSGNGNHAYPYNNPLRVPAERPFLWVVRGFGGGGVRFRLVPRGWHVVVRDATGAEVLHLDTSYLLANAAGFVEEVRLDIVVPGVYEVVLSSVYPLPGEAAVGFGESLLVYSLAGACVVLPVVVAGSRRFELAAVVSSVYFAAVFLYLASGSSVGTWGVALSLAGLSVPLMFLLSLAGLRRFRAEPAAVASVTLAAVLHLVSLGVAAGYGVVPVELGVAYASATVLLWVALVVFGAVRKGLGVVRRVVVVE